MASPANTKKGMAANTRIAPMVGKLTGSLILENHKGVPALAVSRSRLYATIADRDVMKSMGVDAVELHIDE